MISAVGNFIYNQSGKVKYKFTDPRSCAIAIPVLSSVIQICKLGHFDSLKGTTIQQNGKDTYTSPDVCIIATKKVCKVHFAVAIIVQALALLVLRQDNTKISAKVFAITSLFQTFSSATTLLRVL